MRTRTISLAAITPAEERAWRDLAERAAEPNPFIEPDCILAAWRHLPEAAGMCLVVAEEAGRFYACLPVDRVERWSRLHRLALMGRAETTSILQSTPLVDAARGVAAVTTLLSGLREVGRTVGAGLLVLDWFAAGGVVEPLVSQAAAALHVPATTLEPWQRPALYRRSDPSAYWLANLGHETQKKLRQKRRRLAAAIGPLEVVERAGDPTAPEEFLRLESSGWKMTAPEGQAFARREQTASFFKEVCAHFADSGRLIMLSLQSEDRAVAMVCSLRAGNGVFGYRLGHDTAYGRYSPGVQILLDNMEHVLRHTDAAWLDSCTTPDNRYLPELMPDARPMTTVVLAIGGPVDRAFVRSLPALSAVKRATAAIRSAADQARRQDGRKP